MSKLLKYHVIGTAVDGQQTVAGGVSEEATAPVPVETPTSSQAQTRSEPDIFQLPPLPDAPQNTVAASSR